MDIRKHFLHQHEKAGLMRDHSKEAIDNMSMEDMKIFLRNVGEKLTPEAAYDEIKYMYKKVLTTRYLLMWQDHSTIANHGHLLLMVRCLYDPAIFYTPQEMLQNVGRSVDVQEIVERPRLYILARSRDTVTDKLAYVETRMEDIDELQTKLKSGQDMYIEDIMRFFNSDHPEQCYERGQQEGGERPCAGCHGRASLFYDLTASFRADQTTLEQVRQKVSYYHLFWKTALCPFLLQQTKSKHY